jgi:hypothetical protein
MVFLFLIIRSDVFIPIVCGVFSLFVTLLLDVVKKLVLPHILIEGIPILYMYNHNITFSIKIGFLGLDRTQNSKKFISKSTITFLLFSTIQIKKSYKTIFFFFTFLYKIFLLFFFFISIKFNTVLIHFLKSSSIFLLDF